MIIKLDKNYEVKTTLGTIREIEKTFGKAFLEVINSLGSMKIEEQITLIYAGVKKANADVELAQFIEVCEDNLGMGELMEYLEEYIFALQYPGLTEAEAQERLEKKLQKNKAMSQATQ